MGEHWRRLKGSARAKALVIRVMGHASLALIAVTVPAVGPNRFWLAGLLVGVGSPIAVLLNIYVSEKSRNWVEALFDLLMVITLVHLVPHLWVAAMCLGLMVAIAPSVTLHPAGHWIYLAFGLILLTGMSFAALDQGPDGWELAIAALAVTYPSMLYYTYTQVRRANELRRRAQLVSSMVELAGSVAHDFNNMLTSVRGFSELALESLPAGHPARDDMMEVLDGADRASLLSNQLLSFAGRNVGRRDRVDLTAELSIMSGLLRPALPAGVVFKLQAPEQPLYVDAEVSRLHQVLMNVLLRAGDAMAEKSGIIEITLSRSKDAEPAASGQILVSVVDHGRGVAQRASPKLFDPFYSTKEEAHGLGLAATCQIMQEVGGDIVISSCQGGGTEVQLRWPEALPLSRSQARPPQPFSNDVSKETPLQKRGLILVVDDEEPVRAAVKGLLYRLNYDVITASNAKEAIATFEDQHDKIDTVLLDLKMPGIDGWSCLEELRKIHAQTPVVVCSGYNPNDHLSDLSHKDPNLSFLRKPFRSDQLAAALVFKHVTE